MKSRKKLAANIFNIELAVLEQLAQKDNNFREFDIIQGTKKRKVEVPKPIVERLHRRLFALFERIEKPAYLQSGVKGRSYITNAKAHVSAHPLVTLDIQKFYPSVDAARVYRFFNDVMQCSPDVSGLLTKLCTHDGHVPTGSCLSQLLAYFATRPLFDSLASIAEAQNIKFTLYVDDLTFSGVNSTPSFLWEVKKIIHAHGMKYHKEKVYAASTKKVVTGVLVTDQGISIQPSKEFNIWLQSHKLGSGNIVERLPAIESFIGTVIAAGQIEKRLLSRVLGLRMLRAKLIRNQIKKIP